MNREHAPGNGDLRLLLDSAAPADWAVWLPSGLFHGITTNPLLLERAGRKCTLETLTSLAREALAYDVAEIHLQAWGATAGELCERGRALHGIDPRVLVKLPLTPIGLTAARELHEDGIGVTLTALYHPRQVVAAAASGAVYAAPYLGRMTDAGRDGMAAVATMHAILKQTGVATRLLVASLRSADQVASLAGAGLDTFTVSPAVAAELVSDELTEQANAEFERAAREAGQDHN